jgi:hypothetical protein
MFGDSAKNGSSEWTPFIGIDFQGASCKDAVLAIYQKRPDITIIPFGSKRPIPCLS